MGAAVSQEPSSPDRVVKEERVSEESYSRRKDDREARSLGLHGPALILLGGSSPEAKSPERIRIGSGCSEEIPP